LRSGGAGPVGDQAGHSQSRGAAYPEPAGQLRLAGQARHRVLPQCAHLFLCGHQARHPDPHSCHPETGRLSVPGCLRGTQRSARPVSDGAVQPGHHLSGPLIRRPAVVGRIRVWPVCHMEAFMPSRHLWAACGLLLSSLLWAGNALVGRAIAGEIPPLALSFWRWTLALCILLPFVAGTLWRHRDTLRQAGWRLLVIAALGTGAYTSLLYTA